MAAPLPQITEDGRVYTFTLREDVRFHNGAVVTVDDVIKSFETCAATSVDSALAAALSAVTTVEAPDESTIQITLEETNGDMLSYIASVYISPAGYDQSSHPVGTGPFLFVSRSVQDSVVLAKFDAYWGAPAYLDQLTFKIFEDSTALMTALRAGSVDFSPHMTVDQLNTLDANEFKTQEGTMNLVQALYLNHAVAPFDEETVRRALCHAVQLDARLALTPDG